MSSAGHGPGLSWVVGVCGEVWRGVVRCVAAGEVVVVVVVGGVWAGGN